MYHRVRLVLASQSPRRRELLRQAGYDIEVVPADVDERRLTGEAPAAYVERLARAKAGAVASRDAYGGRPVLGADTTVVLGDETLGKPASADQAHAMLERLSGRTHVVLTAVALVQGDQIRSAVEATRVTFVTIDPAVRAWYVATGEPLDKAGAYGVQAHGARFVDRIEGSYTNVVGLPLTVVERLWRDLDAVSK